MKCNNTTTLMQENDNGLSLLEKEIKKVPAGQKDYYKYIFIQIHKCTVKTYYNRVARPKIVDLALWYHVAGRDVPPHTEHFKSAFRNIPTYQQSLDSNFQLSLL